MDSLGNYVVAHNHFITPDYWNAVEVVQEYLTRNPLQKAGLIYRADGSRIWVDIEGNKVYWPEETK